LGAAKATLTAVRAVLEPQYRAMQRLFGELESAAPVGDTALWDVWRQKLSTRARKILDALLARNGEATRDQISTLAGISRTSSDLDKGISELYRNGLIDKVGKLVRLRVP